MGKPRNDYPYDDYGFERYEENAFPIAYLLTFSTYGTRLHVDDRGSHERSRDPRFRAIRRERNVPLAEKMSEQLVGAPRIFTPKHRQIVHQAIQEVCDHRNYLLRALNVRSNHGHAVVSAALKPEKIVNDFKAYATRKLRGVGEVSLEAKIWTRGASTKYLWKPADVAAAIEYVLYSQGDTPFGTVTELR